MRAPRLFRRSRGPRRNGPVSRRVVTVGAGSALVAAMVLGAATSSAHESVVPIAADDTPHAVADVAVAAPVTLLGFAPPAARPAPAAATPQLRLAADLPTGPLGIPGVVLQAYKLAANRVAAESPACKLPWFLLAGIGRIESNHASNGSVDQFGTTINPIAGPVLDGSLAGNEVIRDTDGGAVDGDPNHDRAMGPMQFIPSTWKAWGTDANGDGKADPNNIFDATYSSGRYLCAGVSDIMSDDHKVSAVMRYNHSLEYARNVLSWAAAYATGVMPTNPIPEPKRASTSTSKSPSRPSSSRPSGPSSAPSVPGSPSPSTPTQQCFGPVCLPPGITVPGQPAPAPTPSPKRTTPTTTPAR
ncbi:lytic transglycosylase domain-containing protein [Gordonia sp. NB41Y]|uniref:lytic transglycosylase domain-containing protein n=1 Tax=Gordonia sp. NB41Y TaxID=875808 RepID=UPI0006B15803|nr:lytic transglycosylase domain-containing protein [Gordonia sp. NB41Y]KOY49278.1 murein transglycosylase [Gordonia sp. NB41Y]WLP91475.1 lytic transglycosylase domain-containing protein [Gordonia sp. NB41Y]